MVWPVSSGKWEAPLATLNLRGILQSPSKSSATKIERGKNACVKDSKGKVKAVNNEELKKMESEMKK